MRWNTITAAGMLAATTAVFIAAAAGAAPTGGSGVIGSATEAPASAPALSVDERSFVAIAAADGLYEVEVAELASVKAADPAVKAYAVTMAAQHDAANNELAELAGARRIDVPKQVAVSKQRVIDRLAKASGPEFDRQFVQTVGIEDHQDDIARFETASRVARDPALKEWIAKTLPALRQHLAAARALAAAGQKP